MGRGRAFPRATVVVTVLVLGAAYVTWILYTTESVRSQAVARITSDLHSEPRPEPGGVIDKKPQWPGAATSASGFDEARDRLKQTKPDGVVTGELFSWGVRSGCDKRLCAPASGLAVSAVGSGGHCLAVSAPAGLALSWGRNDSNGGGLHGSPPIPDSGQLGRSGPQAAPLPVAAAVAAAALPFVQVAAGRYHSAAVTADGSLVTWGLNDMGQLGRAGTRARESDEAALDCVSGHDCRDGVPRVVAALPPVVRVTAGRYSTVAVDVFGALWAVGLTSCGLRATPWVNRPGPAVKPPTKPPPSAPVRDVRAAPASPMRVEPDSPEAVVFKDVDAGYTHMLALDDAGRVWACASGDDGYAGTLVNERDIGHVQPNIANAQGELGELNAREIPFALRLVPGLTGSFVSIAAGRGFSMAASAAGDVFLWGVLGSITKHKPVVPTKLALDGHVIAVDAGEYFAVLLTREGVAWTAGSIEPAYLARASNAELAPIDAEPLGGRKVLAVSAGYQGGALIAGALATPADSGPRGDPLEQRLRARAPPYSHTPLALADASPAMRNVDPALFAALPPSGEYSPLYKNPCWHRGTPQVLVCLPAFQILGVSKCGTTNLFALMLLHAEIGGSSNKGPHWWDERRPADLNPASLGTIDAYLELFAAGARRIEAGEHTLMLGEASSNTFTSPGVVIRGRVTPSPLISELLAAVLPDLVSIVILREPISRYISAFYYYNHADPSEAKLVDAALRDTRTFATCVASASDASCARTKYFAAQQLIKGMYALFVDDWAAVYPPHQLLYLSLDALKREPRATLAKVFSFIGAREPTADEWALMLQAPVKNPRRDGAPETTVATLDPAARAALAAVYAPLNKRLGQMLGPEFDWSGGYVW